MSKKRKRREKARIKLLKERGVVPAPEEKVVEKKEAPKPKIKGIKGIYENYYKKLLIIPLVLLILAIAQIGYQTATTGDFINKGVSIKGGISLVLLSENFDVPLDAIELEEFLKSNFQDNDVSVRTLAQAGAQTGVIIDIDVQTAEQIKQVLDVLGTKLGELSEENYNIEVTGSSLGESFFRQTIVAVLIAFLFMAIVVFLYFKTVVPSIAVVLAAFSDILITLSIANILGIKISTAGIAAFLMLIGYSVDTDILLTTRILKRKEGTVLSGVYRAMKTGLTMSFTTIIAVSVALIFSQSLVLKQIMTILLIGLLVDLINTWIQNAGILRWHLEKKK
ncbi:protein translocase subunit SecF [Candidatus Woesearchaeota archaeon]|nr:protein translocase subunit SecF [Candidatus Woesearchaeota archaeon]